jgi:hypothetical protein
VRPGAIRFIFPPGQSAETLVDRLRQSGWWVRSSSARTGEGVEDAFKDLAVRVTG